MPIEVTVDAPHTEFGAVDPDVKVPEAVRRAAAAAEAFYRQPEPAPVQEPQAAPEPETPPPAPVQEQPAPEVTATVKPEEPRQQQQEGDPWKQRYHSMEGRFKQAMSTINTMQDQMRQMGDELVRMQEFVKNGGKVATTSQGKTVPRLTTEKDREVYGDELLDVVARRATEVLAPKLGEIEAENQQLRRAVQKEREAKVKDALDANVPKWRGIYNSPRFQEWLKLTDLLAGSVRGRMLNAAFQAADAPRVVAFFHNFLNEEAATGSTDFVAPSAQAKPQETPAPRQPALALDALAAPGRAKPAQVDAGKPTEAPVITRASIKQFYDDVRKGFYAGRPTEKQAFETAMMAAQRAGRVQ